MSGIYENLPFARGSTYFGVTGGAVTPTLDDTSANNLVGKEYIHQDNTYGTGSWVKVRVCRNDSGVSLAPSRAVRLGATPTNWNFGGSTTAGSLGLASASGYAAMGSAVGIAPEKTAIVDDLLKYSVPSYDLFYIVVQGPVLAYTSTAAADFLDSNTIGVGDLLHAATGVTTGALTGTAATASGRLAVAQFGATSGGTTSTVTNPLGITLIQQLANVVGRAMSSMTSSQTSSLFLIQAGFGFFE